MTAFGGWSTTVLLLEKELVETGQITKTHLYGAVAFAQVLPGATQIQIVSNVGYRLRGTKGALLAVLCYITPALCLFLLFSLFYFGYLRSTNLTNHLGGISASLGGVLLANAYRVSKMHVTHYLMWLLVAFAAAMRLFLGVSVMGIVLLFGIAGLGLSFWHMRRRQA